MPSLDEILAHKRMEVEALKARLRRAGSTTVMKGVGNIRSMRDAIQSQPGLSIIPELKKADPWRGLLHERYQAIAYGMELAEAGAVALAIQTDTRYFNGSMDELYMVSRRVSCPVLQRDFIIDDAQITEGKAKGADAVVLIAGLLEVPQLKALMQFADYIWLETVVEVRNAEELDRALGAGAKIIGIQNRDLHSQTLQIDRSLELRRLVPEGVLTIVVGGLSEPHDVEQFRDAGFDAAIVGDWLMRAKSLSATYREMVQHGDSDRAGAVQPSADPSAAASDDTRNLQA